VVLGLFRKRSEGPEEAISEDLLANVPVLLTEVAPDPAAAPDLTAIHEAEEALSRLSSAWGAMEARLRDLEAQNERLAGRLREAEAKAAILDEVKASLNRAK